MRSLVSIDFDNLSGLQISDRVVSASSENKAIAAGAASQDVIDTARVLQLGEGLKLFETDLDRIMELLCDLALRHRRKVFLVSTPKITGMSRIEAPRLSGSVTS